MQEQEMAQSGKILRITVIFERRGDGGLRARSDDMPGLLLSGPDPEAVFDDVIPALHVLAKHNLGIDSEFMPLVDVRHALEENGMLPPKDLVGRFDYGATIHPIAHAAE